jgi:hypothetical protein
LINLGFLLRERLATVLIIPSSWGSQLGGYPSCIKQLFQTSLLGKKKISARGVSHAHPLLCFSFALFYFLLASFYQKYKKISFLFVVIFLLACF